jgi:hypothetical protein
MPIQPQYILFSILLLGCATSHAADPAVSEPLLTFERDVRPILKTHCFQCHGESGVTHGSLDLRLRHLIMTGGESGRAIAPGDANSSLIVQRIALGEMPPDDKRFPEQALQTLRLWIAQGAPTARAEPAILDEGQYITEEERDFWAFQPVVRPTLPETDGEINNSIDAFILADLKSAGLEFSAPAERVTLLRRLSFDLWGLPPSPQMVREYLEDESSDAYSRLVDRLLANPRYGERWGRHWLDVAGYADSEGYTNEDTVREFAYFYRDYVIRSFNDNKPLDAFIREQLAGDEMDGEQQELSAERIEHLAATGFLRMAPDGTATAADRMEAANETIADTLNIVSTSLLGLTVGCARCHDHRYDPISQVDYYRLRSIFEPALDWQAWKTPNQRRVSLYTDAERQARAAIEEKAKQAEQTRTACQQSHLDRTLYEELLVVPDDRRSAVRSAYQTKKEERTPEQIAILEDYPNVANISPGSLYLYAEQRGRRAKDIEKAGLERQERALKRIHEAALQSVAPEMREDVLAAYARPASERTESQVALAHEYPGVFVSKETLGQFDTLAADEMQEYLMAAEVCRKQDAKTELAKMQQEIAAIRASAPQENFVRALVEPANHSPTTFLFVRGDHNQPAQPIEPDELQILQQFSDANIATDDPMLPSTGRRLAYAKHLTDGKHPLLARVLMNRVWLHHFGRAIVETPGDFGMLGARPSHPELLDWLADELVRSGWDLKHMQRLILLSRTYQQASRRTQLLESTDPENRLFARMNVRRLESEAVRDAILSASGLLIDEMYGPPVPVKEDAVGQIVLGKEMLDGERKPTGEDSNFVGVARRSLYVQVRRTRPLATLEAFDLASNAPNCTQRNYSNVAMQPLLMMNSQFALDHSERMAVNLMAEEVELSEQLQCAWLRCYGAEIDGETLKNLTKFHEQQHAALRVNDTQATEDTIRLRALASVCHALFSLNEFVYVD